MKPWQDGQSFPCVCSTCLGENTMLRMSREQFGSECRVCLKPFTVFRWSPGPKLKFRRTEICQNCARMKHVCQSCLLDLQYQLPVAIRDQILGIKEEAPKQAVNREYYLALKEGRGEDDQLLLLTEANAAGHDLLQQLADKVDRKHANLPPPCSFYAKGTCNRGDACPYRHVLLKERGPTLKSYRDRYFGDKDAFAERITEEHVDELGDEKAGSTSDLDPSRSLMLSNLQRTGKAALLAHFARYGAIEECRLVKRGTEAILCFVAAADAVRAAEECDGFADLDKVTLRVRGPLLGQKRQAEAEKETEEPAGKYRATDPAALAKLFKKPPR